MVPVEIVSAGSLNFDLNTYAWRLPVPGETLLGEEFSTAFGGKGANQAIQAARLYPKGERDRVALIGHLGNDMFGQQYLEFLRLQGLNTSSVTVVESCATGIAQINVSTTDGENTIVVVPGANYTFRPENVSGNPNIQTLLKQCKVLLLQNEIPITTTVELMRCTRKLAEGAAPACQRPFMIFSPAPAVATLPNDVFTLPDLVILNHVEAQEFLGRATSETVTGKELATAFKQLKQCLNVVVTLGARGCYLAPAEGSCLHIPAISIPSERVVDTVGAGDSFAAAVGFFIAQGFPLRTAVSRGQFVAAQSIQKKGASSSYPYYEELHPDIFSESYTSVE